MNVRKKKQEIPKEDTYWKLLDESIVIIDSVKEDLMLSDHLSIFNVDKLKDVLQKINNIISIHEFHLKK